MTILQQLRQAKVPHEGYSWSMDYELALRLLESGSLFGLVLYDIGTDGYRMEDVCRIMRTPPKGYSASVRGISYFDASDESKFKELCKKYGVYFLVPGEI